MISNQIIKSTIEGLKNIARVEFSVTDMDGGIVASTCDIENRAGKAAEFAVSPADSQEIQGWQYFKVFDEQQLEYILMVGGVGEDVYTVGKMAVFQFQGLLAAYKEHVDRDNFIKNLLLDNLLLVDIYNRAKKLHIRSEAYRAVVILEMGEDREGSLLEPVKTQLGGNNRDFITAVDENSIVIVKELLEADIRKEIEKTTRALDAVMQREGVKDARIAYGTVVKDIREVSRSYKEAKMALEVGRIFFADRDVIAYSELGIGRLIYQLPIPLCKMYIQEIFEDKSLDEFDEETLTTIYKFFENSLNVSETARQLFIHRNTLVYRLDKLMKATGLDLRVFEDAISFKIALMVVKYMKYMESLDY